MPQFVKPWYTIKLDVSECGFDVRINDCPIRHHVSKPSSLELPINHWIVSGQNVFTAKLIPLPGNESLTEDCRLTAEIKIRESSSEVTESVAVINENGGEFGEVFEEGRSRKIRLSFNSKVPFGPWRWEASQRVKPGKEVLDSLIPAFEKYHSLLKDSDFQAATELCDERSHEMADALYEEKQAVEKSQIESFEELGNGEFKLQPLHADSCMLWVFANGRIATITNKLAESWIYYLHSNGSVIGQLPTYFRLDENREWVICR